MIKNIQELERAIQYQDYKDRIGQIVFCVVKQMDAGNLIVDIGRNEAILLRNELLPRENYNVNDRIKAYIYDVRPEPKGPQIFLSRTRPEFLAKLFAQEVPEIADGLIEIKAIARDPGSRAKVAIASREERLFDAIGACVGVKGSRVNAVSQELCGEKIDVIPWSPDVHVFVVNALIPAEVLKVVVENKERIKVVVADDHQGIAIGRRGQNVKLAHQLTGIYIEIVTESTENQQRAKTRQESVDAFIEHLDVDDLTAHFLVSEGFESINDLARASIDELGHLQGMTPEIASELKERALEASSLIEASHRKKFLEAKGDPRLLDLGIPFAALSLFVQHRIFSVENFADLDLDECREILGEVFHHLSQDAWGNLILEARNLAWGNLD